jgi:hypothetical protein
MKTHIVFILAILLAACSTPAVRQNGSSSTTATDAVNGSPSTDPVIAPPVTAAQAEPLPGPVVKSFSLMPATTALVAQAHVQLTAKNSMLAAATIERALRIEPNNPLLWIEYAGVRMSEQNFFQAESMGRKAVLLANGDPRTQSNAWHVVAECLRAQNKTVEAQLADDKAASLIPQ